MPTTTVLIIPALNEEAVIGLTLQRIPQNLFSTIIVADNGSTDRTVAVARQHGAQVVSIPERGYGAACLAAMQHLPPDCDALVFLQGKAAKRS